MPADIPDVPAPTMFKAGDVVRLKSGGPKMTVTQCGDDGYGLILVWTIWFDDAKKVDGNFPAATVEAVKAV